MTYGAWVVAVVALIAANVRWLRVAQREHYAGGRTAAIAILWCRVRPVNAALFVVALTGAVVSVWWIWAICAVVVVIVWPIGMSLLATSAPLRLTARMRRVVLVAAIVQLAIAVATRDARAVAGMAALCPLVIDSALWILTPVERALGKRFVISAQAKLAQVRPTVVAITGSYGKTSTKLYTAHILSRYRATMASPASFNNLMGLSTTVNKQLTPGTDIFIAEMGTYGPGEIRHLCEVFHPEIAAITTIGEAHLERMKNRATIVRAKSEITEQARAVVLNVDVPELADLADTLDGAKTVWRCSASRTDVDVAVVPADGRWTVWVDGAELTTVDAPPTGHATNLAIAIGLARAAGLDTELVPARLTDLPVAAHRAEMHQVPGGPTIIDDTYNSNPDGATRALAAAKAAVDPAGTVWTVTPGMIELGKHQAERNAHLAADATDAPNLQLVITGWTNRRALRAGAQSGAQVQMYPNRTTASKAVLAAAKPGDVIVYLNDLPDHYA